MWYLNVNLSEYSELEMTNTAVSVEPDHGESGYAGEWSSLLYTNQFSLMRDLHAQIGTIVLRQNDVVSIVKMVYYIVLPHWDGC